MTTEQKAATNRTARISIAIDPALKADLEKIRTMKQISLNSLIMNVLAQYRDKQKAEIQRYDEVFKS